jgi:photosystem II stability/assembly factor-like uncharacterized protein
MHGLALIDQWTIANKRSNSVLRSEDGGLSWKKVLEVGSPLYSVTLLSTGIGFATPRWLNIYKTEDGGLSWKKIENDQEGINYIFLIDDNNGWAYGGGGIWKTVDAGNNWNNTIDGKEVIDLYTSWFTDEATGWIVGTDRQIWHMVDGKTWAKINLFSPSPKDSCDEYIGHYGVCFLNKQVGWITGSDGSILFTEDKGENWKIINLNFTLLVIRFFDNGRGLAISSSSEVMLTTDGGKNWKCVLHNSVGKDKKNIQ